MPTVAVLDMAGKEVGKMDLSDAIFGIEPNQSAMHDAVICHLANLRQGTQSAKTRAEVSGGGKKPWRQKGTGHARQGSIRAPQWRHGGIVFAPKPRDYSMAMNKKEKRLALKSALSSKVLDSEMVVVDKIAVDGYHTKDIVAMLKALGSNKKALIVLPQADDKVISSAANIRGVKTAAVNTLSVYDILNADKFIVAKDAVARIEEVYA
ncbi:MAG: 50S ribosomal protein L4 [Oscillospiraceae bacterium]|jgi:large subunit ribosomal protein L4|nr:50S ribosomal protein L4 [Oscillospiraceae bacterium]